MTQNKASNAIKTRKEVQKMLANSDVDTSARRLARLVEELKAREGGEEALAAAGINYVAAEPADGTDG